MGIFSGIGNIKNKIETKYNEYEEKRLTNLEAKAQKEKRKTKALKEINKAKYEKEKSKTQLLQEKQKQNKIKSQRQKEFNERLNNTFNSGFSDKPGKKKSKNALDLDFKL